MFCNQYIWKIGNQINDAKQHRLCIEMWRKAKHHDNMIQQKKCSGFRNTESHFNPDQTKLKISVEIKYTSVYIQAFTKSVARKLVMRKSRKL